jgi:hypothetical protein
MHPLAPDLSQLKDEELRKKQADLMQKLNTAYRFGNNSLVAQIQMLLQDYNGELGRRQQKQLDELLEKNSKFKDIIDVKK